MVGWNVKNIRGFNGGSFDISKEISLINSLVASHTARISFHNTTEKIKVGKIFTLTDSTLSSHGVNIFQQFLKSKVKGKLINSLEIGHKFSISKTPFISVFSRLLTSY